MKTIEERAKEWAYGYPMTPDKYLTESDMRAVATNSYIQGATEQKAIDIDKACEWLKENVEGGVHPQSAYGFVDKFRKEMEE